MSEDSPRSILIVDDMFSIRTMVKGVLQHLGYRFFEAGDGQEGFTFALKLKPDLVITDYEMPVLNGIELSRKLRAEPTLKKLRIIMLSRSEDGSLEEQGAAAGVDAFLPKPIDFDELEAVVRRLLP